MNKTTSKKKQAVVREPAVKKAKFGAGEHIRVVPLHHPKPEYSIDDLTKARKGREESEDSELFDGKPHAAPLDAKLTFAAALCLRTWKYSRSFGASSGEPAQPRRR